MNTLSIENMRLEKANTHMIIHAPKNMYNAPPASFYSSWVMVQS